MQTPWRSTLFSHAKTIEQSFHISISTCKLLKIKKWQWIMSVNDREIHLETINATVCSTNTRIFTRQEFIWQRNTKKDLFSFFLEHSVPNLQQPFPYLFSFFNWFKSSNSSLDQISNFFLHFENLSKPNSMSEINRESNSNPMTVIMIKYGKWFCFQKKCFRVECADVFL